MFETLTTKKNDLVRTTISGLFWDESVKKESAGYSHLCVKVI